MFFPGCKVADLEGNIQEYSPIISTTLPYVVTTVGSLERGFTRKFYLPPYGSDLTHLSLRHLPVFEHFLQEIANTLIFYTCKAYIETLLRGLFLRLILSRKSSTMTFILHKLFFSMPLRTLSKVLPRLPLQSFTKRRFTRDCRAISPSSSFASMSFRQTSAMLQKLQSLRSISVAFH